MSKMFRCPNCKEVIRTGDPTCQYCKTQIDDQAAHAEVLKLQAGVDACAAANHIKSINYAAPFLLLADVMLPFLVSDDSPFPIFINFVPFAALAGAFGWFTKYGGLKTDDPDFPEAKQAVKKAVVLWTIMSAVHAVILAKTFLAK
jgi:hypothetical protein